MTEYLIYKNELKRRIYAFLSLSLSLIFGLTLFFILYRQQAFITIPFIATCILSLLSSILLLIRFFKRYENVKITLDDTSIKRTNETIKEEYMYKNVKGIKIVRTTRKDIREIQMTFKENKRLDLNAIHNSENFLKQLLKQIGKDVKVIYSSEPLDYDHPLFYPILGIIISFVVVYGLDFLNKLKFSHWVNILGSIYAFGLAIYFILIHPLRNYYGKKSSVSDYIIASLMILGGISLTILTIS